MPFICNIHVERPDGPKPCGLECANVHKGKGIYKCPIHGKVRVGEGTARKTAGSRHSARPLNISIKRHDDEVVSEVEYFRDLVRDYGRGPVSKRILVKLNRLAKEVF